MTSAAPSGVVTFLFTDVEGSTSRWVGIATDEAELRGTDYFGAVLNCAARVAAGHGGRSFWPSRRRFCSAESIWWIWGHGGRNGYSYSAPQPRQQGGSTSRTRWS
jgi:hypothetical protein